MSAKKTKLKLRYKEGGKWHASVCNFRSRKSAAEHAQIIGATTFKIVSAIGIRASRVRGKGAK